MKTQLRSVDSSSYYQNHLKFHFDQICNQENWKYPIDCLIPTDKFNIYNEAVVHFTAGSLKIVEQNNKYIRCTANGYYVDCGA